MNHDHLSYPSASTSPPPTLPQVATKDKSTLKDRIFVGNLSPTVDEFTLLQLFSKFGAISKFDFLFHRTGPLKGKPRGYAFVEYANADDASRALAATNEKPLRGRNLIVTYAHQAPDDYSANGGVVRRKTLMESGRPTTLSMLKEKRIKRASDKTEDKIALMEAKLRQMEASSSAASKPLHASLPIKPDFTQSPAEDSKPLHRPKTTLPSLPIPPSKTHTKDSVMTSTSKVVEKKKSSLVGVKIVKKRPAGDS